MRLAAALLAFGCTAAFQAGETDGRAWRRDCCKSRYAAQTLGSRSTALLGKEYRRLKAKKCPDCKLNGSDLQKIMRELGIRLNGQRRAEVEKVMGPPDRVRNAGLIYFWRYEHDYLRFTPEADSLVRSSWYRALE
ncbi:hypothetical protein LJY25_07335 [Hymenobacter sp. BT175]|uniref:hypothetical protein n=1 Tax=Hymenobacter translucens TaxID=2886507 RepID=UPI001D0EFB69|nr:hypothetical protein [Hymenobacter translucens]MCC2546253.1 hypothetical protein [Hymenobacter translucens]